MNRIEAVSYLKSRGGKFFSLRFVKRSTGESRLMLARLGVHKHLKGGPLAYIAEEKDLLGVWDVVKRGYRCIAVEGITHVKVGGKFVEVN